MDSHILIKIIFKAITKNDVSTRNKKFRITNDEGPEYMDEIFSLAKLAVVKKWSRKILEDNISDIGPGHWGDWVDYSSPYYFTDVDAYGKVLTDWEENENAYEYLLGVWPIGNVYQSYKWGILNEFAMRHIDLLDESIKKKVCDNVNIIMGKL